MFVGKLRTSVLMPNKGEVSKSSIEVHFLVFTGVKSSIY